MGNDISIVSNSFVLNTVDLPSPDNFEAYSRAVNGIPMLTEEDERTLSIRWFEDKDLKAAKDLILSHLRLVVKVVKDHKNYGYPLGDLVQEGNIGLMKAVKKFDPYRENRLSSYALLWIEAEIRDFLLSNLRAIKIGGTSALKKLFFGYRKTVNKLRSMGEDSVSDSEHEKVAQILNVDKKDVLVAEAYFNGSDIAWEQTSIDGEENTLDYEVANTSEGWMLPDYNSDPQDIVMEERDSKRQQALLFESLAILSEKERDILTSRKLKDSVDGLSVLAKKWGISMERVRQIENEAQNKIMRYIKNKIPA